MQLADQLVYKLVYIVFENKHKCQKFINIDISK